MDYRNDDSLSQTAAQASFVESMFLVANPSRHYLANRIVRATRPTPTPALAPTEQAASTTGPGAPTFIRRVAMMVGLAR